MWGKLLAGSLLGLPLSLFAIGALVYAWPGAWQNSMVIGMIALFPLWISIIAASPLFRSTARAWLTLGCASALAAGLLCLVKWLGAA
jgi:hypothetical protein